MVFGIMYSFLEWLKCFLIFIGLYFRFFSFIGLYGEGRCGVRFVKINFRVENYKVFEVCEVIRR